MIQFQFPEFLLLAIPLWFAFRRWGAVRGVTGWLRGAMLVVLLVAITGPEINVGGRGIDVVVVADRSRSLSSEAHASIRELVRILDENRDSGDRVALVTFGSEAQLERVLTATGSFGSYQHEVLPDGSDLNDAVLKSLNLVDKDRPARILVLSDGEANGPSPLTAARRAREDRVPIDFRIFERVRAGDVAVESLELPQTVAPREPFQFSALVYADMETTATVRLLRDGKVVSSVNGKPLTSGRNQLLFGDVLEHGGSHNYAVEVEILDDPLPENNRGAGVVRVDAGPRLLVLNSDGSEGNLVRALQAGRVPVDVFVANEHALTQDELDRYRAVVIENVPADDLGRLKMERLAQFVEDLGGGLMLTGGERSFGVGGYFKSPLDPVLPVSMELREEHRKMRIAIAIAMDRSGSMMMPVKGGKLKMDLANLGAAECVNLLSSQDKVAVLAVDTSPHVIQPLTSLDDKAAITSNITGIQPGGGGIFVYEALVAAGDELKKADGYRTRHIILFSDAQDSERPGDFRRLLKEYERAGITVSVIGLGTKADKDAALLEEIARLGRGNVMFTADAEELPRLFTQDTMSIARSTFLRKDDQHPDGFAGRRTPGPHLAGNLGSGPFPNVDGYNLSYLKPDAQAAVISTDEYRAPWSAFWNRGLGRVAALTIEADGPYSGAFGRWDGSADFLITQARWLLGGDHPDEVFVDLERDGQDAVVTVELDPNRPVDDDEPALVIVPPGDEREKAFSPEFQWTGPDTLATRFRMDRIGTYRTLVKTGRAGRRRGAEFVRGPSITLPYSPEYLPRVGLPTGKELLAEMAALSGGQEWTNVVEVFADPPRSPRMVALLPWLLTAGIVLLLVEIAGRRLSLWERLPKAEPAAEGAATARPAGWRPKWKLRLPRRRAVSVPLSAAENDSPARDGKSAEEPVPAPSMANLFEQAKQRAKRRRSE